MFVHYISPTDNCVIGEIIPDTSGYDSDKSVEISSSICAKIDSDSDNEIIMENKKGISIVSQVSQPIPLVVV